MMELIFYPHRLLSYSLSSHNEPEHLLCFQPSNQYALSLKKNTNHIFSRFLLILMSSSYKPTMRITYPQPNLWLLVWCASMSSLQMVSAVALNSPAMLN